MLSSTHQNPNERDKILNTELRFIKSSHLNKLSQIIDNGQCWKKIIIQLTQPDSVFNQTLLSLFPNSQPFYLSLEAIDLIEKQEKCGKSPTAELLNYWSITGRRRPTILNLVLCLEAANLLRAVEYVNQNITYSSSSTSMTKQYLEGSNKSDIIENSFKKEHKATSNQKHYQYQPGAYDIEEEYAFVDLDDVDFYDSNFVKYSFDSIYKSTNGFCHKPFKFVDKSGTKIGEGRFSTVYIAKTSKLTTDTSQNPNKLELVAAKLLKKDCNKKHLINELDLINGLKHENLLELLGIATIIDFNNSLRKEVQYVCLIYSFMSNGSLYDCLQNGLNNSKNMYLTWQQRINITVKVCQAICFLHNDNMIDKTRKQIIHRDIKTANILIDENAQPKLGDFTLVRQFSTSNSDQQNNVTSIGTSQMTQNIIGTTVYMPPEAFRGDISTKFDTFSFGVVILELLSGMKPFDDKLNEDLLTFINDRISDIEDDISLKLNSSSHQIDYQIQNPDIDKGMRLNTIDFDFINNTNDSGQSSLFKTDRQIEMDKFLYEFIDTKAGDWNFEKARDLFNISLKAVESRKKARPTVSQLRQDIELLLS